MKHGWYKPETRIGFYQKMEAFLAVNIGSGSKTAAAPAARIAAQ